MFEQVDERGLLAGAGEVVQLELLTPGVELVGHAQQRGDPDAPGDQDVPVGAGGDGEQVAGFADLDVIAGRDLVQRHRATPGLLFALTAIEDRRRVRGWAAQRVLAQHPGGADDVDMRAGLIGGEVGAVLAHQAQGPDRGGLLGDLGDGDAQPAHSRNPAAGTVSAPSINRTTLPPIRSCAGCPTEVDGVVDVGGPDVVAAPLVGDQGLRGPQFHNGVAHRRRHHATEGAHRLRGVDRGDGVALGHAGDPQRAHPGIVVDHVQRVREVGLLRVDRDDVERLGRVEILPGPVVLAVEQFGLARYQVDRAHHPRVARGHRGDGEVQSAEFGRPRARLRLGRHGRAGPRRRDRRGHRSAVGHHGVVGDHSGVSHRSSVPSICRTRRAYRSRR